MLGLILFFRLSVSRLSMKLNKNLLSLGKFFCIHFMSSFERGIPLLSDLNMSACSWLCSVNLITFSVNKDCNLEFKSALSNCMFGS